MTLAFAVGVFLYLPRTKIELPIVRLFIVLMLSLILLIISLIWLNITLDDSLVLRNRYWFFQFVLAISAYKFINHLLLNNKKLLFQFFSFSLYILLLIAIIQLIAVGPFSLSLLSSEPSQAGGVLLFWFLGYVYLSSSFKNHKSNLIIVTITLMIFLLMGSKAIFLILLLFLFLVLLFRLSFKQKLSVFIFLFPVFFILFSNINFVYIDKLLLLANVLTSNGLAGLDYSFGIYDSFIVRVGSTLSAMKMILDYPYGIGFGVYNSLFSEYISMFVSTKESSELNAIISGASYATPKSYFLELTLSIGAFGIFILLFDIFKEMMKANALFKISILCILAQSMIVELTPFLAMVYAFLPIRKQ